MAAPDSGTCAQYQDLPVQLAIAGELRIGGSASLEDMRQIVGGQLEEMGHSSRGDSGDRYARRRGAVSRVSAEDGDEELGDADGGGERERYGGAGGGAHRRSAGDGDRM